MAIRNGPEEEPRGRARTFNGPEEEPRGRARAFNGPEKEPRGELERSSVFVSVLASAKWKANQIWVRGAGRDATSTRRELPTAAELTLVMNKVTVVGKQKKEFRMTSIGLRTIACEGGSGSMDTVHS